LRTTLLTVKLKAIRYAADSVAVAIGSHSKRHVTESSTADAAAGLISSTAFFSSTWSDP
jgi:hypothetical protein